MCCYELNKIKLIVDRTLMKTAITIFSAVVNPLKLSSDQSGGWTVAGGDGTTPAAVASSSTSRRPASISELPTRSTWASRCHSTFHTPLSMTSVVSVISPCQHTAIVFTVTTDKTFHVQPFDTHCCHMGTVIEHPVPDRVKPSFVIFDIRALWRSRLSVRVPGCQKLQTTA